MTSTYRKPFNIACAFLFLYLIMPWRFASHYSYLSPSEMKDVLWEQVTRNISQQQLQACDYDDIIEENSYSYQPYHRAEVLQVEQILLGGEYYPEDCRPRFSSAIIIPYRQREQQLHAFLTYMHNYLRLQRIHYRIFLVEQYDQKPFNRAKLFNIGVVAAAAEGYPCVILHDVDLMPLNVGQLYVCTERPRHMCSSLDKFRFNLPYSKLFGGAVAMRTEQFRAINGMSNLYEGWGGEDDDLYERLQARNYDICRFAPRYSEYTMLRHKPEKPNPHGKLLLKSGTMRMANDGLNSLVYEEKERRLHSLFTHLLVET